MFRVKPDKIEQFCNDYNRIRGSAIDHGLWIFAFRFVQNMESVDSNLWDYKHIQNMLQKTEKETNHGLSGSAYSWVISFLMHFWIFADNFYTGLFN